MMTPQEKIQEIMMSPQEKIQEILDKCPKADCIFRGENKKYDKISSGLYRQYCQSDNGNSTNDRSSLIDSENFLILEVEKNIVEEAKKHIRIDAPNIEVLTELQHRGGKTALLDFSKNIHVALFFACDGNFKKDGRVILFKTSELIEATDIDYKKMDENKKKHIYTLISPTGKSPRVIFQSSIFVHVSRGYLEKKRYEVIEIEKDIKKPLLKYLRKHFNIKAETIYNDIQGFIDNQHNYSNSSIEFYRGWTKYEEKKFKEAIEHYNKAIELNPRFADVYNNRGNAKNTLAKAIKEDVKKNALVKEAIEDYDKAIEHNPKDADVYNNRGNAKNTLAKAIKEDVKKNALVKEAIEDYDKAIELNPKYAEAYYNRGIANATLGNYKEAIKDYSKAIEFNPQLFEAYYNRGNANATLGNYEEVIKNYSKAIELNPQLFEAYYNQGNANTALGNYKKAIKDYDKAIERNPKITNAYNNRGSAKNALGRHKEAIKDYDKAIELNHEDAEAYYNRGNANFTLSNYTEAIKDYDEAIKYNSKFAEAYYNRGNVKNTLAKAIKEDVKKNALIKEAIEDYDKAIELNPKYAEAYYNRGIANSNLREYTKAIADYTEAKKLFEKKGEVPMVERCKHEIERLKKLMAE